MAHICCLCMGLLLIKLMVLFSSNHFSAVSQHNWFRKTPSVDWINKSLVSCKFNSSQNLTKSIFMLINSTPEFFLMSHGKTDVNKEQLKHLPLFITVFCELNNRSRPGSELPWSWSAIWVCMLGFMDLKQVGLEGISSCLTRAGQMDLHYANQMSIPPRSGAGVSAQ